MISTLPESTTLRLLGDTHEIARRMTRRIAEGNELPRPFRSLGNLRAVTKACREALDTLLTLLREGRGLRPGDLDRLGAMGAREAENGLPLEVLLGAYRIAARVLWEEVISESVQRNELAPDTVVTATGYVLEYFDLISSAVGRAYLETREKLVLQRDRERERILQRLLAGDVATELPRLAAAVDLKLRAPYQVVACSFESTKADTVNTLWEKNGGLVVPTSSGKAVILAPIGTDLQRMHSDAGKEGLDCRLAMGPVAQTLADVAACARAAEETLDVATTLNPRDTTYEYGTYAPFIVLQRNPDAADAFIKSELGGLDAISPRRRSDALQTIQAVLETSTLAQAADLLKLHRHTLMYRVEKLGELGIDLQDPERRYRLWLAIRMGPLFNRGPV